MRTQLGSISNRLRLPVGRQVPVEHVEHAGRVGTRFYGIGEFDGLDGLVPCEVFGRMQAQEVDDVLGGVDVAAQGKRRHRTAWIDRQRTHRKLPSAPVRGAVDDELVGGEPVASLGMDRDDP